MFDRTLYKSKLFVDKIWFPSYSFFKFEYERENKIVYLSIILSSFALQKKTGVFEPYQTSKLLQK